MEASKAMDYEKAIEYRDPPKQRQAGGPETEDHQQLMDDRDVIAMARDEEGRGGAGVLRPGGKAHRREHFHLRHPPWRRTCLRFSPAL